MRPAQVKASKIVSPAVPLPSIAACAMIALSCMVLHSPLCAQQHSVSLISTGTTWRVMCRSPLTRQWQDICINSHIILSLPFRLCACALQDAIDDKTARDMIGMGTWRLRGAMDPPFEGLTGEIEGLWRHMLPSDLKLCHLDKASIHLLHLMSLSSCQHGFFVGTTLTLRAALQYTVRHTWSVFSQDQEGPCIRKHCHECTRKHCKRWSNNFGKA